MPANQRQRPFSRLSRAVFAACVLGPLVFGTAGCGGNGAAPVRAVPVGTLSFANETDQGSVAFTVVQIFVKSRGEQVTPQNLLAEPIAPGGLVIVGQFPEGLYDVLAVVDNNLSVPFNGVTLVANQPTTIRFQFD